MTIECCRHRRAAYRILRLSGREHTADNQIKNYELYGDPYCEEGLPVKRVKQRSEKNAGESGVFKLNGFGDNGNNSCEINATTEDIEDRKRKQLGRYVDLYIAELTTGKKLITVPWRKYGQNHAKEIGIILKRKGIIGVLPRQDRFKSK